MPDEHTDGQGDQSIDRVRGWAVTLLYAALGLFALLMVLATLNLWMHLADAPILRISLLSAAVLAALFCFRSGYRYYQVMRANVGIPRLHLVPFLLVMLMIVLAGQAFTP